MTIFSKKIFSKTPSQKYSIRSTFFKQGIKSVNLISSLTRYKHFSEETVEPSSQITLSSFEKSLVLDPVEFHITSDNKPYTINHSSYIELITQSYSVLNHLNYHPFYFFKLHLTYSPFFFEKLNNLF